MDTSPEEQTSALLSLPGEILNQIYRYVLTTGTEAGLYYREIRPKKTPKRLILSQNEKGHNWQSFNQLQYACRKTFRETKGLEIKLNPLTLSGSPHPSKSFSRKVFTSFAAELDGMKWIGLKTLILDNGRPFYSGFLYDMVPATNIAEIVRFCHRYSHMNVKYLIHVRLTSPATSATAAIQDIVASAVCLSHIKLSHHDVDLRSTLKESINSRRIMSALNIWWAYSWRLGFDASDLYAQNFKIWPKKLELDEEVYKAATDCDPTLSELVDMVKEWINNGA